MAEASHTKMEELMYRAGLDGGLKDVERGTKLPYPTLINVNRGFQMVKGKKLKYTAHRGTRMILEKFFGKPWGDIFEDKCGEDSKEQNETPSTEKAISGTFKIDK